MSGQSASEAKDVPQYSVFLTHLVVGQSATRPSLSICGMIEFAWLPEHRFQRLLHVYMQWLTASSECT